MEKVDSDNGSMCEESSGEMRDEGCHVTDLFCALTVRSFERRVRLV